MRLAKVTVVLLQPEEGSTHRQHYGTVKHVKILGGLAGLPAEYLAGLNEIIRRPYGTLF